MDTSSTSNAVRHFLKSSARFRVGFILVTSVLLPTGIAIFVNLYTSLTPQSPSYGGTVTGLVLLVTAQVLITALFLWAETQTDHRFVADAADNQAKLESQHIELKRREDAYKMVRQAFDSLNQQTCVLEDVKKADDLCKEPMAAHFKGIGNAIFANASTVFGVRGTTFTIEIFMQDGYAGNRGPMLEHDFVKLQMEFFYSPVVEAEKPLKLKRCSPAILCFSTGSSLTHHVSQVPNYFCENSAEKKELYFRRFAVSPLRPACSPENPVMGAVVLTSMQDEPFAEDVLDSLGFVCSIVSNFVYRYQQCALTKAQVACSVQANTQQPTSTENANEPLPQSNDATRPI